MKHFDETKLAKLHTASELLESKYGKEGTKSRREFEEKARAYFHEVILRKQRKSRNTNRFPYTLYNIGAKKVVPLLLFLAFLVSGCSQKTGLTWIPFQWEGADISGKYIEKAFIYVPVNVEDLPYDYTMQLDLGTYDSRIYGKTFQPYLAESKTMTQKLDSTNMFHGLRLKMGDAVFENAKAGYMVDFGDIVPEDSLHSGTPKHVGTIGPDLFQGKVLIIDYPGKRFAVTDSVPDEYKALPSEPFEVDNGITKLSFKLEGQEEKLMFDTGSSPFQLVTTKERALAIASPEIVDSLSGPLWWGQMITFYGFKVNKPLEVSGKARPNSVVYYDKEGLWKQIFDAFKVWGITGNAYFYDNMLIIDYKNKVFRVQ